MPKPKGIVVRIVIWIALFSLIFSGCKKEEKKDEKTEESVRLSKAGESCAKTADCEAPLRCISQVCQGESTEEVKEQPTLAPSEEVSQVAAVIEAVAEAKEVEEELLDEEEGEDTTAKTAKSADSDSKKKNKVAVSKGDLLLDEESKKALAEILNSDSTDFNLGLEQPFAGEGFKGVGDEGIGTGGGGDSVGYIGGIGEVETGSGTPMTGSLGEKRKKKGARLKIGAGMSSGFCSKSDVKKKIRRRKGALRACYEKRLQVNPNLHGKITPRWTINVEGKVEDASVSNDSLGDSAVSNCVLRVIRRIRFAKPEGGVCVVQWPFTFSSK